MDINFTPEKSKQIALARLDLIYQWQEFRRKSTNKLLADYDFVKLHNTSSNHLFEVLGKISRGSLHRWKSQLNGTDDYEKLLPQYKYSCVDEYRTVLSDEEIKIFMELLLHPNRLSIGKATTLTKYKLKQQGQNIPLAARIMAIADVYDALRARRVYKEPFSQEKACEIIKGDAGTQFDSVIVKSFLNIQDRFNNIWEKYQKG